MSIIEKFKQYPIVLWTLALYLCSIGFNLKYDIPLTAFVLSLSYFFLVTHTEVNVSIIKKEHWHVIVFLLLTMLVTLTSTDVSYSAMAQVQFMPSILIYLAVVSVVRNEKDLRFIYIALVFIMLVIGLALMWELSKVEEVDLMMKLKLTGNPLFIVPNDVLFLVVLSPIALAMVIAERSWMLKSLAVLSLVCVGLASIYIGSRQAAAIYAFSFFIFFFLWRPWWGIGVGIVALVLVFGVDALLGGGLVKKLFLFPRAYIWKSAWQMFLDSPLLGKGPGHFKHFYYEYLAKAGYGKELVEDRRLMNWAHSLYFEQLAERGVIGLVALLVLVGRPVRALGLRLKDQKVATGQKASDFVTGNPYLTGLLVAYIAFLLGGIAEASLLRLWTVTLLFLLSGLACIEIFRAKTLH